MTVPDETTPSLLSVRNLSVGIRGCMLLRDLNFSIYRGEMLALVGESGCGKSLTGASLMRFLPAPVRYVSGEILFDNKDLVSASNREMRDIRGRRISMIMQEPMTSLNPVLKIGRQIAEILQRHENLSRRAAGKRALELLELVGIPEPDRRAEQYPHNFSGGMRQRVMIAIAVACSPELLVADEPTTALDVSIQAQIMELLEKLRRELSMAVLLITHDLGVVAQWASRVIVMYAGRIVEEAQIGPFYEQPAHPYSLGLLGSLVGSNAHDHYTNHRLKEIPGTVSTALDQKGCPFVPRCNRSIPECSLAFPDAVSHGEAGRVACIRPLFKEAANVDPGR